MFAVVGAFLVIAGLFFVAALTIGAVAIFAPFLPILFGIGLIIAGVAILCSVFRK